MFKKLVSTILIVAMILSGSTLVFATEDEMAYDLSLSRLNAIYDYLNTVYVGNDDYGFDIEYATQQDIKTLQALADYITVGCSTDTEKSIAIWNWMDQNVHCSLGAKTSYSPIDVFRNMIGICSGHAQLMSALMKLSGIQAAVVRGYLLNTTTTPLSEIYDGVSEGHQWVMAYVDGDWYVFDDLWEECGNNNREEIASKYYAVNVDGVSVYTEGMDLCKDEFTYTQTLYKDGEYLGIESGQTTAKSGANFSMGGCLRYCKLYYWKDFNAYYTNLTNSANTIIGNAINGGYYLNKNNNSIFYVKPTGISLNSSVITYDNTTYYTNGVYSLKIDEDIDNNGLSNGQLNMYIGEEIDFADLYPNCTVISGNKNVIAVEGTKIIALTTGISEVAVLSLPNIGNITIKVYGDVINSKDIFKEFCSHDCTHCVLDETYCDYCGQLIANETEEATEDETPEEEIEEVVEEPVEEIIASEPAIETPEAEVIDETIEEPIEETTEPAVEEIATESEPEVEEVVEDEVETVEPEVEEEIVEEAVEEELIANEEESEPVVEETPILSQSPLLEQLQEEIATPTNLEEKTIEEPVEETFEEVNDDADVEESFASPIEENVEEPVLSNSYSPIIDDTADESFVEDELPGNTETTFAQEASTPASFVDEPIASTLTAAKSLASKDNLEISVDNVNLVDVKNNSSINNNSNARYTLSLDITNNTDIDTNEILNDREIVEFLISVIKNIFNTNRTNYELWVYIFNLK